MSQRRITTQIAPLRLAMRLARRGYGTTSPNPMVGAVLVKGGQVIGRGWHRRAGGPHAEIEALADSQRRGHSPRGATLYVTLEPCSTHGRTPPCTDAIIAARIKRVVVGAVDPNPQHAGRGFEILRRAGIEVGQHGNGDKCAHLNEAFNHWIVHRTPFVTVKAAMTLDGKIATASGESKWITGEKARAYGMKLRQGSDAILVGINTLLADDPSLTVRSQRSEVRDQKNLRRIVLDSMARTPLTAKVVNDDRAPLTTIVVSPLAPKRRIAALAKRVKVLVAPAAPSAIGNRQSAINLRWLLRKLGAENVTSLLVEGGGEVNASFLLGGFAQRVAFFYAPKILGGRDSRKGVAGDGVKNLSEVVQLQEIKWRKLGPDLLLTARVGGTAA
jgi:diaminohydroxyphosphoribosylaminopyrimidine deaminase/5-amino-6-(5-phosphoribosylamino)uracil reductase